MPTKIRVAMRTDTGPPEDQSLRVTCTLGFGEDSGVQDRQTVDRAFQQVVAVGQQAVQEAATSQPQVPIGTAAPCRIADIPQAEVQSV